MSRAEAMAGRLSSAIDYRLVILGSLLPDLIDKPLGVYILSGAASNGRIFAHSLLFVLLMPLAAFALRGSKGVALSLVALGSLAHLAEDKLWTDTRTLLWPLAGWQPPREDVSDWAQQMMELLFRDPYTYVSEIVGASVIAALLVHLMVWRGLRRFALTGRLELFPPRPPGAGSADGEERTHQVQGGQRAAER